MARHPRPVAGVYERVPGSNIWSARIRVKEKLVRKSFGRGPAGRADAIAWVEKARTIKAWVVRSNRTELTIENK